MRRPSSSTTRPGPTIKQARIDSYQVYVWSRIILDCRREMAQKPADRITALEEHLGRMKKLEALITRIRRLGFGRSYDVGLRRILSPRGRVLARKMARSAEMTIASRISQRAVSTWRKERYPGREDRRRGGREASEALKKARLFSIFVGDGRTGC